MLRRTLHPKRSCTLHNPLNSTKNQEKLARDTTDIQNYISIMKSLLTRNKFKLDRDPEEEMNATEESQV